MATIGRPAVAARSVGERGRSVGAAWASVGAIVTRDCGRIVGATGAPPCMARRCGRIVSLGCDAGRALACIPHWAMGCDQWTEICGPRSARAIWKAKIVATLAMGDASGLIRCIRAWGRCWRLHSWAWAMGRPQWKESLRGDDNSPNSMESSGSILASVASVAPHMERRAPEDAPIQRCGSSHGEQRRLGISHGMESQRRDRAMAFAFVPFVTTPGAGSAKITNIRSGFVQICDAILATHSAFAPFVPIVASGGCAPCFVRGAPPIARSCGLERWRLP